MGICLDTDKKNDEEFEIVDGRPVWQYTGGSLQDEQFPIHNNIHIKFEMPKIPVIFVLGGPGSGKVTHCDNLAEEKRGIIHINMTDLLQQYAVGNGENQDFNQLSSRIVAEVLMLEIKMSPAAKTILISGYPRNMRDVVEYTDKIKTINGVILLVWNQISLERQIEYGAKLGQVVLSLARMELENFFKNVIPVVDFYDQRKLLTSINGERIPNEVYKDFRVIVLRIIGSREVGQESISTNTPNGKSQTSVHQVTKHSQSKLMENKMTTVSVHVPPINGYPTVVFVIGGPGSNKAEIIKKVLRRVPNWRHISIGELLREAVDSRFLPIEEAQTLRDTIAAGELVEKSLVGRILDRAITDSINLSGIVLDGFPRDMAELREFEEKYDQHPPMILLDCSKLQLSRGRWDDSIPAFRRRLELFREKTLPMIKVIDTEHRLTMVDGDTETPEVEESFTIALFDAIQHAEEDFIADHGKTNRVPTNANFEAAILQDLHEDFQENKQNRRLLNGYGPSRSRERSHTHNRGNKTDNTPPVTPNENSIRTHAQVASYPNK